MFAEGRPVTLATDCLPLPSQTPLWVFSRRRVARELSVGRPPPHPPDPPPLLLTRQSRNTRELTGMALFQEAVEFEHVHGEDKGHPNNSPFPFANGSCEMLGWPADESSPTGLETGHSGHSVLKNGVLLLSPLQATAGCCCTPSQRSAATRLTRPAARRRATSAEKGGAGASDGKQFVLF